MKDESIDGCQDIRQNGSRHIGNIALLKNEGKQIIKGYIKGVTEDSVPNPNKNEANLCLMPDAATVGKYVQ